MRNTGCHQPTLDSGIGPGNEANRYLACVLTIIIMCACTRVLYISFIHGNCEIQPLKVDEIQSKLVSHSIDPRGTPTNLDNHHQPPDSHDSGLGSIL